MTTIDEIRDNFEILDEWDDRYRYVIEPRPHPGTDVRG
ncbi:sulfur transfer protein SufE [Bradyrhizobium sp. LB7.2]